MNDVNARAVAVFDGWEGHFRRAHRGEWEPVLRGSGQRAVFATAAGAELEAWRALRGHFNDIEGVRE